MLNGLRSPSWPSCLRGKRPHDANELPETRRNGDGTISVWDDRWVEVSPLYFVRADGRGRIGFAADSIGRIVALTAGSWRVVERVR